MNPNSIYFPSILWCNPQHYVRFLSVVNSFFEPLGFKIECLYFLTFPKLQDHLDQLILEEKNFLIDFFYNGPGP